MLASFSQEMIGLDQSCRLLGTAFACIVLYDMLIQRLRQMSALHTVVLGPGSVGTLFKEGRVSRSTHLLVRISGPNLTKYRRGAQQQ